MDTPSLVPGPTKQFVNNISRVFGALETKTPFKRQDILIKAE